MKKRFFARVLIFICCLFSASACAQSDELLPPNAVFDGNELPEGWFSEAWLSGEDEYSIVADADEKAVCITNYIENDARLCYTLKVKKNTCYTLSCDVKTENVENGQGANIAVTNCMAASQPVLGTEDWRHIELTGKTGKTQKELTVCVRVGGYGALSSGTAWFRNVSLLEVETAETVEDFAPMEQSAQEDNITEGKVPHFGAILLLMLLFTLLAFLIDQKVIERKETELKASKDCAALAVILAGAFLLRVLLSKIIYGHPTDINCFMAWGNAMAQNGCAAFYTSGMFADYPPGYMYVLGAMAKLAGALGLSYGSDAYVLLIKLPAILCDVASAYFVYRIAKTKFTQRTALWLCALIAFNPMMAFVSGGWGQIDSVLTLLLALSFYGFLQDRLILAGAVFGLAILIKPQALMVGPIYAIAYFTKIKKPKDVYKTVAAVAAAFAVILLLSLPFKSTQETGWLFDKYFSTATSYPYASVEAYNLMALLGGNWTNVDQLCGLFSYRTIGTVLMAVFVVFSCALYIKSDKTQGAFWLCAAYLLVSLFTLGQYMHERYLFPALLLLLMAFIETRDKRLYSLFALFSISMLLNTSGAFIIIDKPACRGVQYDVMVALGSMINLLGWAYFTYVIIQCLIKKRREVAFSLEAEQTAPPEQKMLLPLEEDQTSKKVWSRKDRLLCGGLTLVYALVAFVNLGSLKAPESAWKAQAGESAKIEFEAPVALKELWAFGGISEGTASFSFDDGQSFTYEQKFDNMFLWQPLSMSGTTESIIINVDQGELWLNELAFFDQSGARIQAVSTVTALTDEQDTVPKAPSNVNGMFFDELYHGRTAYEHLHGLSPYENSHPPLGKILIMTGVAIFGMNPFGWRIIGCLLGIAMLPILYAFAKRMFKKTEYAFLAAALFACDFMHFTQTRIATIDVFAVFFILLMYDFMYQYTCMNFFTDGVKKTLRPLSLAGLFFGLGAASKWTCIYAGGGLALVLLFSLLCRYKESRALLERGDPKSRELGGRFFKYTIETLLWCCVFFIAVPVCIYLLSYLPYYLCQEHYDLKGVWGVQKFMFSYHSGLTATHPYQSAWWQWPLDLRPVWYYVGYDASGSRAGTISAFGNPAVWWVCSAALLTLALLLLCGKLKSDEENKLILCAAAANYLPWVLVPRCTFAYHYFPMVPFIILGTVYLLSKAETKYPMLKRAKWIWLGSCVLLFALFYPVISGKMVSVDFIHALEWMPGWTFLGY